MGPTSAECISMPSIQDHVVSPLAPVSTPISPTGLFSLVCPVAPSSRMPVIIGRVQRARYHADVEKRKLYITVMETDPTPTMTSCLQYSLFSPKGLPGFALFSRTQKWSSVSRLVAWLMCYFSRSSLYSGSAEVVPRRSPCLVHRAHLHLVAASSLTAPRDVSSGSAVGVSISRLGLGSVLGRTQLACLRWPDNIGSAQYVR